MLAQITLLSFGLTITAVVGKDFMDTGLVGITSVVVPADYFNNDRGIFQERNVSEFWTPDLENVHKAEARLVPYLAELRKAALTMNESTAVLDQILANLGEQRRQYIGIIVGGHRILHINFLPAIPRGRPDTLPEWRRRHVITEDGGVDFWNLDFDLEKLKFGNFQVNGEA